MLVVTSILVIIIETYVHFYNFELSERLKNGKVFQEKLTAHWNGPLGPRRICVPRFQCNDVTHQASVLKLCDPETRLLV